MKKLAIGLMIALQFTTSLTGVLQILFDPPGVASNISGGLKLLDFKSLWKLSPPAGLNRVEDLLINDGSGPPRLFSEAVVFRNRDFRREWIHHAIDDESDTARKLTYEFLARTFHESRPSSAAAQITISSLIKNIIPQRKNWTDLESPHWRQEIISLSPKGETF